MVNSAARDSKYLNLPVDITRPYCFQLEYLAAEGNKHSRAMAKELFFDIDSLENIRAAKKKAEE